MTDVTAVNELWRMSACDLADGIRRKEFSCSEVVKAHLTRISRVNPAVNAVTVILEERALSMAKTADNKLSRNEPAGRLHGVPFTVKENLDLADSATTSGMVVCKDALSPVDAPHIAQLLGAGAIPIARTNLSEMSLRPHTDNELNGPTLNPWNRELTPGGSSGGDTVAVATGMTPLGMGNDYGGSLRVPAQFCGVTSIKPTSGRIANHSALVPSDPMLTLQLFFSNGPIARKIRDLRIALYAMSGYDVRDPLWIPAPIGGSKGKKPVKVALVKNPSGGGVDDITEISINRAAAFLQDSGYIVEEAELPSLIEGGSIFIQLIATEMRTMFMPVAGHFMSEKMKRFLQYWLDMFPEDSLADYMNAFALRNGIAREWNKFFEKYPVIVGPGFTYSTPAVDFDIDSEESFLSFMKGSRLIFMANLLGIPALSMPVGIHKGLPMSVQLLSGRFNEDICMDVAEDIEKYVEEITPISPKY